MTVTAADLAAEALFVSDLQPSQQPTRDEVAAAVSATVARLGSSGCAGSFAHEFGDHPETALRRMAWVREILQGIPAAALPRPRD
ncbi:hypothetical protein GCM10010124_37300 [Pilimelia terevasa]|uniref:Uncharacterized protein n=1 Tax=Pilimelia terevasa TaxID=53372 RepID=A0A8J3BTT3_9ACTN|nr:hypothetical protein [Pilimelia terevasa]GGK41000.1 hypothetical protein GCM10010124_37300 [Pilimelia terevasa]